MPAKVARFGRLGALFATLIFALALASAPVIEAVKHGPAAQADEADHRAFHAEHGHDHDFASGHHDSSDHDHVGAALLAGAPAEFHPAPDSKLRPDVTAANETIRDGPRRPPRLTAI